MKYIIPDSLQFDKTYDPEVNPFIIPKLGPLYTDVWFKDENDKNSAYKKPSPYSNDASTILPKKVPTNLMIMLWNRAVYRVGPYYLGC